MGALLTPAVEQIIALFSQACEDAASQGQHEITWDTFEKVRLDIIFQNGWEQLVVSSLGTKLDPMGFQSVSVQCIDHTWWSTDGEHLRGWLNIEASWPAKLEQEYCNSS